MLEYFGTHKEYMLFWAAVWFISFATFGGIMYASVKSITTAIREKREEERK